VVITLKFELVSLKFATWSCAGESPASGKLKSYATSYVYIDSLDPSLVLQGGQAPRLIYLYRGRSITKSYSGEGGENLLRPHYGLPSRSLVRLSPRVLGDDHRGSGSVDGDNGGPSKWAVRRCLLVAIVVARTAVRRKRPI
jgi:hypothetical protein